MRRAPGAQALFRSVLLGLILTAAAQPGPGRSPDLGKRWAGAPPATAHIVTPDLGKRWAGAPPATAHVVTPLLGKRWF